MVTDRQTNRPTDIATYRAAIAAKNCHSEGSVVDEKCAKLGDSVQYFVLGFLSSGILSLNQTTWWQHYSVT